MKKNTLLFILLVLLFPMVIKAEECDSSNISIGSLKLVNKSDNTVIVSEASVVDNKINLDLKFSNVEDYAQYTFVIKNDSNDDYELSDKSINIDSDYIDYTLNTEDNLDIIKAGEEKTVILNIKYNKEVDSDSFENGEYSEKKIMNLNYSYDKNTSPTADILENPKTGALKYLLLVVVLGVSAFLIVKERRKSKIMLLLLMLMIPLSIRALCTCNIAIESSVVIEKISSFKVQKTNCGGSTDTFEFEFKEGMTLKEWINSDYFNDYVDNLVIENNISEDEVEGYIAFFKEDIYNGISSNLSTNMIDNTNDYVLKENDFFEFSILC